jgi:hypothetical protein
MRISTVPYSLPSKLEPDLDRVRAYWEGLKRGEADMPFWDDAKLSALPDLTGRLMLIEVFDKPWRFRFGIVGEEIKERYRNDLFGKFLDAVESGPPLDYLHSQLSATLESRAPTFYRHGSDERGGARAAENYSRVMLPMWGEGRVRMFLGAVAWR